MPAKSKAQQRFMGMVHAIQKGEFKGKPSKRLSEVAKKMDPQDAKDFAATKTKDLPEKKALDSATISDKFLESIFVRGFLSRISEM